MKGNSTEPISYVAGLTHPSTWIHDNDQIILLVGMSLFFILTVVLTAFAVCAFSAIYKRPMWVSSLARVIVYCMLLGIIYMYTSAREGLYERQDDKVLVRSFLVLGNGAIQVLLIYVGSIHCVLHPTYDRIVLWIGLLATGQTVWASFVSKWVQWPGWIVGSLCYIPIPFVWIFMHRRSQEKKNPHVIFWVMAWMVFRTCYALIQLLGHTFMNGEGLDTTTELALMLVLHVATLALLMYTSYFVRAPPKPNGRVLARLDNGDEVEFEVNGKPTHHSEL